MQSNAAVIAHFDPNPYMNDNFLTLLSCVEDVFDVIVLVTTSDVPEAQTAKFKKIISIRRPNLGYDFFSYRVGLSYLFDNVEVGNIILVNSSFLIVNTEAFTRTLAEMLRLSSEYDVVGITESRQINWHLQSYLLLLGCKVLESDWMRIFFENIQPLNSKLEVILNYEIGLSRALLTNNVKAHALFQPNASQRLLGETLWMSALTRANGWQPKQALAHRHEVNWTHFGAEPIAREFGIIKTEVLRTNPHGLSIDFATRSSSDAAWASIQTILNDSSIHYKADSNGLTILTDSHSLASRSRTVAYGRARVKGVRVAVVMHIFYYDLLDEICAYLADIIEPFDLYVTTPFEGDVPKIINRTANISHSVTVWLTENRGRDIGPFISLYRSGMLDGYFAVLKLHSKKSKYSTQGSQWRKQLFDRVVGDSLMIRRTLQLFEAGDIGIVGPHQFFLSHDSFWGANYEKLKRLLILSGRFDTNDKIRLGFFAGSMFWFAPKAFEDLKRIPEENLDFEPESGIQDGTLAHAIERIFCLIAKAAHYKITSVALAGTDISETDTQGNRVPVL